MLSTLPSKRGQSVPIAIPDESLYFDDDEKDEIHPETTASFNVDQESQEKPPEHVTPIIPAVQGPEFALVGIAGTIFNSGAALDPDERDTIKQLTRYLRQKDKATKNAVDHSLVLSPIAIGDVILTVGDEIPVNTIEENFIAEASLVRPQPMRTRFLQTKSEKAVCVILSFLLAAVVIAVTTILCQNGMCGDNSSSEDTAMSLATFGAATRPSQVPPLISAPVTSTLSIPSAAPTIQLSGTFTRPTLQSQTTEPSVRPSLLPSMISAPSLMPLHLESSEPSLQPSNTPTAWTENGTDAPIPNNPDSTGPTQYNITLSPSRNSSTAPIQQNLTIPSENIEALWAPNTTGNASFDDIQSHNVSHLPQGLLPISTPSLQTTTSPTSVSLVENYTLFLPYIIPKTEFPTPMPLQQLAVSVNPTQLPTALRNPTSFPSQQPTSGPPTPYPSLRPTIVPTAFPSTKPITQPPTLFPSLRPTLAPTKEPTTQPTTRPPTLFPSLRPTRAPTPYPTTQPSTRPPTLYPSLRPTSQPTSRAPTPFPTPQPTNRPPTPLPTFVCGDGIINNSGEECDGEDLGGYSCFNWGYFGGFLSCYSNCRFDTTYCSLYTDDLYTDDLYTDDLYTDDLYTDDLYTDDLYTDDLYTDDLYTDDLYTGDLYTDDLYTDDFFF